MTRFLGGESDGAEFAVTGKQRYVDLPITDRRCTAYIHAIDDPMAKGPIKVERYRLERIAGEKQVFEIYVHSDLSIDAAIHRMIQHYRTIPEERQVMERQTFEAMLSRKGLPRARHINSDGREGEYKHCAVQLAWEAWIESSSYSVPRQVKFRR